MSTQDYSNNLIAKIDARIKEVLGSFKWPLARTDGDLPALTAETAARAAADTAGSAALTTHKTASPIDHPNGSVTPARLAAGGTTPDATKFYRGDGTWQAVSGAGSGETFGVVFNNAGDVALKNDGTIATKRY